MTTIDSDRLSLALQALVDARLDTIDRMLLGRVSRQDRLAIVREVESQIHDLLGERDPASLDREDVLAVLSRLDPPEAYLPDESDADPAAPRPRPASPRPRPEPDKATRQAKLGGILGLVALGSTAFAALTFVVAELLDSELLAFGGTFGGVALALIVGPLAVIFSSMARLKNGWAVAGLVTGLLSSFVSGIGFFLLLNLLMQ